MRHAFLLNPDGKPLRRFALAVAICATIASCGSKEPDTAGASSLSGQQDIAPQAEQIPTLPPTDAMWTPEALENLLAPVALYPDVVLAQVLVASTNPQEVLDAGNWLLENPSLQNEALDGSAQQAGFTVPVRALIQFPQVIDMMCQDLDWTSELGQAYVNDQAGVLDATQRLRVQAQDVGNLHSSDEMMVDTVTQDNQQVVTISPPASTEVVYVPQYDPVAVYAAPPTTTTTVVEQDKGYSGGELVATGLLAFGAGMLVNEVFNDDDDYYHGGGYWGRPPPYYPRSSYRPRYGNGFYPSNGYNRGNGNFNNNTVIVNKDNNYWKNRNKGNDRSPISEARRDRPELRELNAQSAKGPKRSAPLKRKESTGLRTGAQRADIAGQQGSTQRNLPKVQGSYAGARSGNQGAKGKVAGIKPGGIGSVDAQRERPKVQGSYAGAKPSAKRSTSGLADRGRAPSKAKTLPRNTSKPLGNSAGKSQHKPLANRSGGSSRSSALSGSNRGSKDRAASKRGRQSMQHRSSSKSHSKPKRKSRR